MTNRFQIERLTKQAIHEAGASFRIFSIVDNNGIWEIWFSNQTPMEFAIRLHATDVTSDDVMRSKIRLELLSHT
jgi:hypothetical protein